MKKGEITAFLGLVFIMLVAFTGSMIESAAVQVAKNYRHADARRAIECVFAEYQKELLEEYDVFALDAGYESGTYSNKLLDKRLEYYGLVNVDNTIERIQFLTDNKGNPFYEQVSNYMNHKYGIDIVKDKLKDVGIWEEHGDNAGDYEKEDIQNKNDIDHLLQENEGEISDQNNPISYIDGLKQAPVLSLVMPEGENVSEKELPLSELVSRRKCNEGYGDFSDKERELGMTDKLLYGEYLLEHFQSVVDNSGNVIDYELEYLIAGKESDRSNLRAVVNQLILLRFVPNYAYLQKSPQRRAEAEAMALTLSSLLAVPAITEAVAQGILLAWAYGEAIVDVRALLKGSKVPLVKDDMSWQLSLSGLLKLGETEQVNDGADVKDGLEYKEYLRILLYLQKQEEVVIRTLDLIEQNLNKIHGLSFFKADLCVTKLDIETRCFLRRGIAYTFPVYFGYQ